MMSGIYMPERASDELSSVGRQAVVESEKRYRLPAVSEVRVINR